LARCIALDLGAGEHDGLVDDVSRSQWSSSLRLWSGVVGPVQLLRDVGVFFLGRVDLDFRCTLAPLSCITRMASCWMRGANVALNIMVCWRWNRELVDFGQVVGKAQVEHAVGLVHDEEHAPCPA
jgi:hypothetical protein